jgi:hypothetical protein
MTDTIERVARAIFEASPPELGRGPLSSAPALTQRMTRAQARAAIEALREPGAEMVAAAEEFAVRQVDVHEKDIWRVMIDAALNGSAHLPPPANDDHVDEPVRWTPHNVRLRPSHMAAAEPRAGKAMTATIVFALLVITVLTLIYLRGPLH